MTEGMQLLFFSALGLAGQIVAVGGALLAFRLGTRVDRPQRSVNPGSLRSEHTLSDTTSVSPVVASAPVVGLPDARSVSLLRQLRLPQVTDHTALSAWYDRLQMDGMALVSTLPADIQSNFRQALKAIRDILETPNLDDRYELLAAALLPVYEALYAGPEGSQEDSRGQPAAHATACGSTVGTAQASGAGSATVVSTTTTYRETATPVVEKNRLAALFEQVESAARTCGLSGSHSAGTLPGDAGAGVVASLRSDKSDSDKDAVAATAQGHHPANLDTSRLSRRLAEILKTADRNDQPEATSGEPLRLTGNGTQDLHLVTPPLKSRLKRSGQLTPEQEVARKAAHVVGRAREWYGRPDITLREVQSACAAFGLEFNEVAARAELAKPLAEEAS